MGRPRKDVLAIEIEGLKEADMMLRAAGDAFAAQRIKEILMPVAEFIRDRAKSLVKRTSNNDFSHIHLRDSIFAVIGKKNDPSVVVGVDRKKAPHAHLVEFGHVNWIGGKRKNQKGHKAGKRVPAHPYMRPAGEAAKGRLINTAADAIRQIVERLNK
jgi:HK97 gp10 family phage protein